MITGYGHIATLEFKTLRTGEARRLRFFKRDYSGAVHTLCGGAVPLKREVGSDEFYGVMPTTVTVTLFLENVYLSAFYATDDRDVYLYIEGGPADLLSAAPDPSSVWSARFMGWLTPFDASEPYQKLAYEVSLKASCGLNSLKDFPFYAYPLARQLSGPETLRDLIHGLLLWAGPARPLWVSMNTFNADQTAGPLADGAESFSYTKVQLHHFKTDTGFKSCFEVLDGILQAFNARLLHDEGAWKLIRLDELPLLAANRRWVVYDDPADGTGAHLTTQPLTAVGPAQQVPLHAARLSYAPAEPIQRVVFPYGALYNILLNGDFAAGADNWNQAGITTAYPGGSFDHTPLSYPVAATGTGDEGSPYGLKITGTSPTDDRQLTVPTAWQVLTISRTSRTSERPRNQQQLAALAQVTDAQLLTFSFAYVNAHTAGPRVRLWVRVTQHFGGETTLSLTQSGSWVAGNKEAIYLVPTSTYKDGSLTRSKPTAGEKFEVKATEPVPGVGNYTLYVELHAGPSIDGAVSGQPTTITYQDMRLTLETVTAVVLDKDAVTVRTEAFNPHKRPRKGETTLSVGSQLSARGGATKRMATLLNSDGTTPALSWGLPTGGGSTLTGSLQELCALGRHRMAYGHTRTFEGSLLLTPGPLAVLDLSELSHRAFVARYAEEDRAQTSEIRAVEILPYPNAPLIKREFETPDGAILNMSGSGEVLPAGAEPGSGPGKLSGAAGTTIAGLGRLFRPIKLTITPKV